MNSDEFLKQLTPDDRRALIDIVRAYQLGRKSAIKAAVSIIVGLILSALGYGLVHWIKTIAAGMGLAAIIMEVFV